MFPNQSLTCSDVQLVLSLVWSLLLVEAFVVFCTSLKSAGLVAFLNTSTTVIFHTTVLEYFRCTASAVTFSNKVAQLLSFRNRKQKVASTKHMHFYHPGLPYYRHIIVNIDMAGP